MSSAVVTHGPYDNREVYELVSGIAPDVVWFPALWPETYSYTLSVALHLGLPVVVPDIGAFSERVEGRAMSVVKPWDTTTEQWQAFWRAVSDRAALPAEAAVADAGGPGTENFYATQYLSPVPARPGELSPQMRVKIEAHYSVSLPLLSRRERILAFLWRLSRTTLVARLVALVPFRIQRALKRRLSSKPMHDIVRNA